MGKGKDKERSPKLVKDRYPGIRPICTNSKTRDKKMYGRLLIAMVHLDIEQYHGRPDADGENRARTVTCLPGVLSGSGMCRTYRLRAKVSKEGYCPRMIWMCIFTYIYSLIHTSL